MAGGVMSGFEDVENRDGEEGKDRKDRSKWEKRSL